MVHTFIHSRSFLENHTQFPVEDPGEGPAPPNFYAKKIFFGDRPPLPLSKGLDDRAPPYLKDWIWHWFQTKMGKIYTWNGAKTLPFEAAHTHMAYLREYFPVVGV